MPTYTAGSEFSVNTTTSNSQENSSVAALDGGGFVAVWDHEVPSENDTVKLVAVQRFDSAGSKAGEEFTIQMASDQILDGEPKVAGLKDGGFVVTWNENAVTDFSNEEVKAQIFDADGSARGETFVVNTVTELEQSMVDITAHENGGFAAVWASGDGFGDQDHDISAQVFDKNGNKVGSEITLNTTSADHQVNPSISTLSNGSYVAVWQDTAVDDDVIYGRIFSAEGQLVGNEILIHKPTDGETVWPDVAGLKNGGFVVAWHADVTEHVGPTSAIEAQLFDNNGSPTTEKLSVGSDYGSSYVVNVESLADGGFIATWESLGTQVDGSNFGVAAQLFDASGNKVGDEFTVNHTTQHHQRAPSVALLKNGDLAFAWQTVDDPSSDAIPDYDISARLYSAQSKVPSEPQRLVGGDGDDKFAGGDQNDLLMGNGGADNLTGNGGDDVVLGGRGNDVLKGNAGADIMFAGAGDDLIWAGSADDAGDTIIGGAGDDISGGGAGGDFMVGGGGDEGEATQLTTQYDQADDDGSDTLFGADGDDTILGGGWDDGKVADNGKFDIGEQITTGTDANQLWAGAGNDLVYGAAGNDHIGAKEGNDTIFAGDGNDIVYGGADTGNDLIDGAGGADKLYSGAGNDTVDGGAGDDQLFDSTGDDIYTGGDGVDMFLFSATRGTDIITDFNVADDILRIAVTTTDFKSVDDVKAAAVQQDGGILLNLGGDHSVLLQGLVLADLDQMTYSF